MVLGLVVEAVSGESYGDFCRERIFVPLGMFRGVRIRLHKVAISHAHHVADQQFGIS